MKLKFILVAGLAFSAQTAFATDGPVKMHPIKDYCVKYDLSGSMVSGTSEIFSRNYGRIVVTRDNIKTGFGGFSKSQISHKTAIGDVIYNIDQKKMTGTRTNLDNPMSGNLKNVDQKDFANSMISALGYVDTGADKTVAGSLCNVYSGQLGTACFTPKGVALETSTFGTSMIANYFEEGCRGDDADFTLYKRAKISEGPDVNEIMKMLGR